MSARKSAVPSPEAIARADRQRMAAEEGVRAIADVAAVGTLRWVSFANG
jgi:hypothetical protein